MALIPVSITAARKRVSSVEHIKTHLPTRDKHKGKKLKDKGSISGKTRDETSSKRKNAKKKCWAVKADNTATMNAERSNTKAVATNAPGKTTKPNKEPTTTSNKAVTDEAIIDNSYITTSVNRRKYDLRGRMKIMGATEEQIEASTKPFISAIGSGSMSEAVGNVIKSAAKIMRWTQKTPTPKQTAEMVKSGLTPEEWLILSTALATQEGYDDRNVAKLLNHEEIIDLMIVINRAAYTQPNVPCSKIKNNQSKATFTSSCWYGAQQALGSWHEKTTKTKTPSIEDALKLAAKNKETNASKTATQRSESKKRKQTTEKGNKARKKATNDSNTESSDDDAMDVLSSSSSEADTTTAHKAKQSGKANDMDIDEDEDDDEDDDDDDDSIEVIATKKNKTPDPDDSDDEEDLYTKPKSEGSQKDIKDTPKEDNKANKPVTTPAKNSPDKPKKKVTVNGIATTKKSKSETADEQSARRKQEVRLQLMLKLKSSKKTPAQVVVKHLHKLYETIRNEDRRAMIMPWLKSDSASQPGITKLEDLPDKFSDWKIYVDRCRPKKDSDVWVKMRFAGTLNPEQYTSANGSAISFWYDEHEHRGYLCPIQDSDTIKTAGVLLYSGPFCDPIRITTVIEEEMKAKNPNKEWKIGVRIRKCIEMAKMEVQQHPDGFVMQDNQLAAVMTDATQTKEVANYLYRRFNAPAPNVGRPGGYDFRFLPEKEYTTTGSQGSKNRQDMFKKHRAIIASSRLRATFEAKHLDLELDLSNVVAGMSCATLRLEIMSWRYPLVLPADTVPGPANQLIRTVDWAYSGPDAGAKIYITAYEDRIDLAERLIGILPNFIQWKYGEDVAKQWCGHIVETNEVEFHTDDDGNWTGEWTTEDDRLHAIMLAEDVGYKLQFDNLQMIQQEERRNRSMLRTDEASLATLGMNDLEDGQTQTSATSTVYDNEDESVAASSTASGGSGSSG